jgi:hypothetical protein
MYNLALLYDEHYKEYDKAIALYKKAHEMGHTSAAANLGHLYANTLKDYHNAKPWYQKGIDMGNQNAVINMGWLYYKTNDSVKAAAYMVNVIAYGQHSKEKIINFIKEHWNLDDQTIQKGYELQLTMDNLPKKYRGGVR